MPTEPGHKGSWSSPAKGWPDFCQWCGKRLRDVYCPDCDMLYDQTKETP